MPGFDGTGPSGSGPMSGRGMGNCRQAQGGCGRGLGLGRGRGRGGYCRFANQDVTPQERIEALKASKKRLEEEIAALEKEQK